MNNTETSWTLYRSKISYFSGKLEAYLKYKNIPFTIEEVNAGTLNKIYLRTGVKKMPALESSDGTWLFDTTPMIAWLEKTYGGVPVIPDDPALAFITLLIEDYGDEWLWRPAMWWRWVPLSSRRTLGWTIGSEMISKLFARFAGWYFAKRQLNEWLWKDGVNKSNENDVRDMLYREFDFLEALLEKQPFLMGSHPSVADYGYFASMFRHFGNDPASAEVMRMEAPNTYEWLARLWNAKTDKLGDKPEWSWPDSDAYQPLLDRIANDYLPYLKQNAEAYQKGEKHFDFQGKNIAFPKTKTTHYRVWCLEVLQQAYADLNDSDRQRVEHSFEKAGGLNALSEGGIIDSGMNEQYSLPIKPDKSQKNKLNLGILLMGQPRN